MTPDETSKAGLRVFVRWEIRVDSDERRVNVAGTWVGLVLRSSPARRVSLSLRSSYGYATSRRARKRWVGLHFLGFELAALM